MSSMQGESRNAVLHALEQPEILELVARELPLCTWIEFYSDTLDGFLEFEPKVFLSCIRVSRLWHQVFMPHLWHYYFNHMMHPKANPRMSRDVFLENFSLVRRYIYASAPSYDDLIFLSEDEENETEEDMTARSATSEIQLLRVPLPRLLWGLFFYMKPTEMMTRLLVANAHQLRELHLQGDAVRFPMLDIHEPTLLAMKSMSYLQELCLTNWSVPTEDLVQILEGCQDTLQILRLLSIFGFEISPRPLPSLLSPPMTLLARSQHPVVDPWAKIHLHRVKELALKLDWTESKTAVFLPRLCPNLESVKLEIDKESDLEGLIRTLREFCPNMKALKYREGYSMEHEWGYFPEPKIFRSLIEDCARPLEEDEGQVPQGEEQVDHLSAAMKRVTKKPVQGSLGRESMGRASTLCSLNITSKYGLDETLTDSILVHAATLEELYVRLREEGTIPQCVRQIQRIMQSCPRLKSVIFHGLPDNKTRSWGEVHLFFLDAPRTTPITTPPSDTMATSATSTSTAPMEVAWACKGLQKFELQKFSVEDADQDEDSAEDKAQWDEFEKLIDPWELEDEYREFSPTALHELFLFIRSQSESLRMVALGNTIFTR